MHRPAPHVPAPMLQVSTSHVMPVVTRVQATDMPVGLPVTQLPPAQVRGVQVLVAVPL